jgi:flagellar biosynthetic protein FliQ
MNETEIIEVGRDAVFVMLKVGGPIMLAGLLVGLIIALIQALTQMQEMTLSFVPKIFAIMVAIAVMAPYMVNTLIAFAEELADKIIGLG